MKYRALLAILLLLTAASFAQTPRFVNAKVDTVSVSGTLGQTVQSLLQRQSEPAWIGYAAPTRPDDRTMCCFGSWQNRGNCCGCSLESDHDNNFVGHSDDSTCGPIEPSHVFFVLFRAEDHHVTRVRAFSVGCPLDVAGLPVHWIENVKPAESISYLTSLALTPDATDSDKHGYLDGAIMAIALHDVSEADAALDKLMGATQPERVREKAAFWVGVERGEAGLRLLTKYVKDDPSDRFREKLIFDISQNKTPGAIPELIDLARHDPSSRVRSQALFWMAQAGGKKVAQNITDAIEDDPETEVKKRAVFALTQMPDHEGVPMLIQVAKTNKNPVVRKQAIFWLGQSQDPRAVDFLEQILTK